MYYAFAANFRHQEKEDVCGYGSEARTSDMCAGNHQLHFISAFLELRFAVALQSQVLVHEASMEDDCANAPGSLPSIASNKLWR